jgi:predicted lysophospholipase L1 biosynthesis ABC-type transport system permease subunit
METPTTAGIQRQVKLPWSEAFRISYRNVTLRLGRAAITAAGIFLGIAFLASVFMSQEVQKTLEREQAERGRVEQVSATAGYDEAEFADQGEKAVSSSEARALWLVIMSLLVSTVGITNAMLMSVTERFREIGTMKCLGALDNFVVRLFLIESIVLGLLGSFVGAVVGVLVMLLVYCIKEGFDLPARLHWGPVFAKFGLCLVVGAFLALLGAIPPAFRAARLPPAAALRSEI